MPSSKPRGRQFFANPGPTNIPDSILRAIDRPTIDFMDPEFVAVYEACFTGVKRVLRTSQHVFMYTASGHGAWEATLLNLFSPGDTVLMLDSGYFSLQWGVMAEQHGLEVRTITADWRRGVDLGDVAAAIEQLVAFGELANDLFGGVVPSFHGDILSLHEGASGLSSTVAHFKGISALRTNSKTFIHEYLYCRGNHESADLFGRSSWAS